MLPTASLSEFFSEEELIIREQLIASLDYDFIGSGAVWEKVIAQVVDGTTTPWRHPWDVSAHIWGMDCRIEVKFARAYAARFTPVRGNDCNRNVFKWAGLRRTNVDAIVLIGLDVDDTVSTLVISPNSIQGATTSLTITAPSSSKGRSRLEWAFVPAACLLNAIAHVCHNTYDAAHRAAGRAARAKAGGP